MPDATQSTAKDIRLPLTSADVLGERAERLKELFPEAFVEGQIDFDRLRNALGDFVGEGRERYGLSWAGKADAIRAIQAPSVGTLVPCPDDSVNFETTENLFIEGDNLEVLKLLQKSYYGKVKMIYIDPPYNADGDFIYPDNFSEGLRDYLRYSGQVNDEGVRQTTQLEKAGRYHSRWLNMLYPRLFLAKSLLSRDGAIFVSIDHREVHNLRLAMNEVFGEENFVMDVAVVNNLKGRNDKKHIATTHEHLLLYCSPLFISRGLQLSDEKRAEYDQTDKAGKKFQWRDLRRRGGGDRRQDRPKMFFPLFANPKTGDVALEESDEHSVRITPRRKDGSDGRWRWGKDTVRKNLSLLHANQVQGKNHWNISYRVYLESDKGERTSKPKSTWIGSEFSTDSATKALASLLPGIDASKFTAKPIGMLRAIIQQAMGPNDIALDLFAGTGTFAEAIFRQNAQDSGRRRFICIQLPEKLPEKAEARKKGFETISAVGRARVRKAIEKMQSDESPLFSTSGETNEMGYRAFALTSSNFKIWGDAEESTKLDEQLQLFAEHLRPDRSEQSVLFELLLKAGVP